MNAQSLSNASEPLVSVAITSFNSAPYLARAIDSVLRQEAAFSIEIVLGDDCSTDGTVEVMRGFGERYPDVVRVLERHSKLGMQRNYLSTFDHCRGKYIAWLDADDYWTDTGKLQMQVSALESEPGVSVCAHFVQRVSSSEGVIFEKCPALSPGRYTLADIIRTNFVPSPSIVFRNGVHHNVLPAFLDLPGIVDWPILVHLALEGDVLLLDKVMADYVLTPGSAYMSKGALYQEQLDLAVCDYMAGLLPGKWQRAVRASRGLRYEAISYHLLQLGRVQEAREAARKAFQSPDAIDNLFGKTKTLLVAEIAAWVSEFRGKSGKRVL